MTMRHYAFICLWMAGVLALIGCQSSTKRSSVDLVRDINDAHVQRYGDFELPRKIGSVENAGLQLPQFSPDGEQMLYLRTDQNSISPMTILGVRSETTAQGTLSVWLRPARGNAFGRRMSPERWAHSPVWSSDGKAFAYVAENQTGTNVIHCNLVTGRRTVLGKSGAINCLPRFDADDRTLLFCSSGDAKDPFRIFRQSSDPPNPQALTGEGTEYLLPVRSEGKDAVICATPDGEALVWTVADLAASRKLTTPFGQADKSAVLQIWAGIAEPLSPSRSSFLYYDPVQNRIAVHHISDRMTRNHRSDSIAACWLDETAIALATTDRVFTVNTLTGLSLEMFNGQWIPCRYVPSRHTLILLGRESDRRFSIVEVGFKMRDAAETNTARTKKP